MTKADLQPTLAEGDIVLRPLTPADWAGLYSVASDPLIWAGHPASDRWQGPVFRRFFDEAMASGGALAIVRAASGRIVGSSRFDNSRAAPGEVEVGWTFLARSEWGGVTNAMVKRLMIGHALQHFERVLFFVGDTNVRSRRALEKIGAQLTDRKEVIQMGDNPVTHVVYMIDREAFRTGPLVR